MPMYSRSDDRCRWKNRPTNNRTSSIISSNFACKRENAASKRLGGRRVNRLPAAARAEEAGTSAQASERSGISGCGESTRGSTESSGIQVSDEQHGVRSQNQYLDWTPKLSRRFRRPPLSEVARARTCPSTNWDSRRCQAVAKLREFDRKYLFS